MTKTLKWLISNRERETTAWRLIKSPEKKHLSDNFYRQMIRKSFQKKVVSKQYFNF